MTKKKKVSSPNNPALSGSATKAKQSDANSEKEWYAARELAGLPGIPGTVQSINRTAQNDNWRSRPRSGRGGGREYHINSLPAKTRAALLTINAAPSASSAEELTAWLTTRRINLSPKQLSDERLLAKVSVARAIETCPASSGRDALIGQLAVKYGKSTRQIRRWHDDVEKLRTASTPRVRIGLERIEVPASRKFSPEAIAFGLAFYANNMIAGIKTAYREMRVRADERGWTVGDYSNFTRIVRKVPSPLWTRCRKGDIGTELSCVPKIIREWTAVPVQSVLCGDQKIFDYLVRDPETGDLIIANGYFWMDCASRMINGAWIELGHYNSYTVGNSLREALRYGIPDEIFTDWGKPELSKHTARILREISGVSSPGTFSDMEEKYGDVDAGTPATAPDKGVFHRKARPCTPWLKPIENIMNLIDQRLRGKNVPGYRKRLRDAWENKTNQAYLASLIRADRLMTVEDFIGTVFSIVEQHNKAEKRLREGGVIVPEDFFLAGLQTRAPHVLPDTTLDYLCLPTFQRAASQSTVTVTLRGEKRTFYSGSLSGLKEKVNISVDPYDREAPAVITSRSGDFIGMAEPWQVTHPNDTAEIARKRTRQAELMKWIRENATRLKEGLGRIDTAIPAITTAGRTARKAAKATRAYELHKDNDRLVAKEHHAAAAKGAVSLAEEMAAGSAGITIPSNSKDRYRLWLSLHEAFEAGVSLSPSEEEFCLTYRRDAEWKIHRQLHEESGPLYIDPGATPLHVAK